MTVDDVINHSVSDFQKTIAHLKVEFLKLQVGRANPALIEDLPIEVYGSSQPMKGVASVSVSDSRTLYVQPWDKGNLAAIEKAISVADLGLNPVNDGIGVRISIPSLTEERRAELTKHVHKLAEEARITVRNIRQDGHSAIKKLKSDGDITEDDLHGGEKKLQLKVDEANKEIDELAKEKENEVMTV